MRDDLHLTYKRMTTCDLVPIEAVSKLETGEAEENK